MKILARIALSALALSAADAARADDFFAGKKITITTFGGAGNNYDAYGRLLARYLGRYIPGNPGFLNINQAGAGGLTALNYAARVAPQDGTHITIASDGLLMFEAMGRTGLSDSLATFKWLGSLSGSNMATVTWHTSNVKTLDDAKLRQVRLGGSGAGAMSSVVPEVYNSFVGTRFTLIQGYQGAQNQHLAMFRGEIDGRGAASWTSFKALLGPEISEGKLHVLAQIGSRREPDLQNVPLLTELVANDPKKLAIAKFISKALTLSRSVAAPPGVPDDRVAILRKAITDAVHDREFLEEAARQTLDIGFVPGLEVQAIIKDVLSTPKDVIEATKVAMKL